SDLGIDQLSSGERGRSSAQCLVEPRVWAKKLLHDLCGPVYGELVFLRHRAEPRTSDILSRTSRDCRRWIGAFRTSDAGGYVPGRKACGGVWSLQYGDCARASAWPNARWLDHR